MCRRCTPSTGSVVIVHLVWMVCGTESAVRKARTRSRATLLANRSLPWWAVGLSVMATQMSADHARRHDGPGVRDRPALHPVLFRPAARDGDPVADGRAVLPPRAGSTRRTSISSAGFDVRTPIAGELPVPAWAARALARRHARRAGRGHVGDPGLDACRSRCWSICVPMIALHDDRRRAGGGLDRRQADVHHRRRACSAAVVVLCLLGILQRRRASARRCSWPAQPDG